MGPAAVLAVVAAALGGDARPVSAAEAVRRVGRPAVVVEMVVKKAKDRLAQRGVVYLDSEDTLDHPDNLGVAVSAAAAAKLRAAGVQDIAAHFAGKTVRVRGGVMRFETRPYLPVLDPDQIVVIK